MGRGGTLDLGWVKITMVTADHSSSCGFAEDSASPIYTGGAAGFIVRLANGACVYHSGDTNVFGDM